MNTERKKEEKKGFASTSSIRIAFKPNDDGLNSHSNCNLSRNCLARTQSETETLRVSIDRCFLVSKMRWRKNPIKISNARPLFFCAHCTVSGEYEAIRCGHRKTTKYGTKISMAHIHMWAVCVCSWSACVQIHRMCKIQCSKLMDGGAQ